MARHVDAEQPPHVDVRRDRQQRVIAAMLRQARSSHARAPAPAGRASDPTTSAASTRRSVSSRIASTAVGGSCLCEQRPGDSEDPRGVRGRRVGAERVREAPVRALDLVARERFDERPVGVAVRSAAGSDHDRRRRLELARARRRRPRRRSRPTARRRGRRRRGRRAGACAVRSRRRRRCVGQARSPGSPDPGAGRGGRRPGPSAARPRGGSAARAARRGRPIRRARRGSGRRSRGG